MDGSGSMILARKKMTDKLRTRKTYSELLQKRHKRLNSITEGSPDILPKLKTNLSKGDILNKLKDMHGLICSTSADRFQVLRRRDTLMSKLRELTTSCPGQGKFIQGTCPDMCPEKERYMRDVKNAVNAYECDLQGRIMHEKMVKDYSRSAADQDMPLEHELRPLDTLQITMDYLIFNIANKMPKTNSDLAKWYDFLWSRTRAIRKDITQQMLQNESAVDLVEKCARLHIFASYKLGQLDTELFDHKMNTENLSKSVQTLRHMYDDLAKNSIFCPNESEFRSYDIMMNLNDFNVHSQVLSYRPIIRESRNVQLALNLASSLQNNNYIRFFRLVMREATFLQACLCYQFFNSIRSSALKVICIAYQIFPLEKFVENLAFDTTEQVEAFLKIFKVELDSADPNLIAVREGRNVFQTGEAPNLSSLPQIHCNWIELKAKGMNLSQILYSDNNLRSRATPPELPKPINSFSSDTNHYVNDPVLNRLLDSHGISTKQKQTEPLSKPLGIRDFSFRNFRFQTQTTESLDQSNVSAKEFIIFQRDFIIEHIISSQLIKIAEELYERRIQIHLRNIRVKLETERIRRFAHKWILYARKRRKLHKSVIIATSIAEKLMSSVILNQLARISMDQNRLARNFFCKNLALNFSHFQLGVMIDKILIGELEKITCGIRDNLLRDTQERLEGIRQNLHKEWLRQFTNHWLSVVRRNRELRSITFLEPAHSSFSQSLSPSRRLFRPGVRKLTQEAMLEKADQWLEKLDEKEEEKGEGKIEQQTNANGFHERMVPPAVAICDQVLEGVSFSEAKLSDEFMFPGRKLNLYRPGIKRISTEQMQQILERRLHSPMVDGHFQNGSKHNHAHGNGNGTMDFEDRTGQSKRRRFY